MRVRILNPNVNKDRLMLNHLQIQYPSELRTIHESGLIFVAESNSGLEAVLGASAVLLAHDFYILNPRTPISRRAAEAIVNYALGVGRGLNEKEAVFVVEKDNESLADFVRSIGASSDGDPASLFRIIL